MNRLNESFTFDPFVPFLFFQDKKEDMLKALRRLKDETGAKRILFCFPIWNGESKGESSLRAYEKFGDLLREVKEELADDGFEIGWWCSPTLAIGPISNTKYIGQQHVQKMVGIDGTVSSVANCPLDPNFQDLYSLYVRTIVEKATPSVILFEDDFRFGTNYGIGYGCFCPRHVERFSTVIGKSVTREELNTIFRKGDAQAAQYRRAWAELMRDSLVELATALRTVVDSIAPDTRLALCQPAMSDFDGDMTEAVAKAFAGHTRPLVRLWGTEYRSDSANSFPAATFHMLYSKFTLPHDFELIHESDSYPHTRFFFSATKLRALLTLSMFYGFDGSLAYITQYTDGPLEEKGYTSMVRTSRDFFTQLRRSVEGFQLIGPQVLYKPLAHVHRPIQNGQVPHHTAPSWALVLGRFGIPCIPYVETNNEGSPVFICGEYILELSEEEIHTLLSGSVFLDGLAASYLCQLGYSELIGVEAAEMDKADCIAIGYEKITEQTIWRKHTEGTRIYFSDQAANREDSGTFRLTPLGNVTVLSEFMDENDTVVAPSATLFENHTGGRVAVFSFNLQANTKESILNYKRKEQFRGMLEWLGQTPLPLYADVEPNVFVTTAEHLSNGAKMAAVFNMSLDEINPIRLVVDPTWKQSKLECLNNSGVWELISDATWTAHEENRFTVTIPTTCATLRPLVLRFSGGM